MITLDTALQPHGDVIATTLLNDETILLHLQTHQYYTLNATGSHIWRSLGAGRSVAEIAAQLESSFDVKPEEAQQTTLALVEELAQEALVQPVTPLSNAAL